MSSSRLRRRDALAPRSCAPKREAERRSMREPPLAAVMRITMSSRKPINGVRAVVSMTASRRLAAGGALSMNVHLRLFSTPVDVISRAQGQRQLQRHDVRIGGALQRRGGCRIGDAVLRPLRRQCNETRRIGRVGVDVGNRRIAVGAAGRDRPDRSATRCRVRRPSKARPRPVEALPPDRDKKRAAPKGSPAPRKSARRPRWPAPARSPAGWRAG